MEWIDDYEWRARIAPTIIVILPIIIALYCTILVISSSLIESIAGSGVILMISIYALSFVTRYLGKRIEPDLWRGWGGAPTTRFMRWRDHSIKDEIKSQIHQAVLVKCGIKLSSIEEELRNPEEADKQIEQAFLKIKAIVRRDDKDGLWSKHNAEYGFHRNLLGSNTLWIICSLFGVAICGILWYYKREDILIVGVALNISILVISILLRGYLLSEATEHAANRYAESILTSFLANVESEPNISIPTVVSPGT